MDNEIPQQEEKKSFRPKRVINIFFIVCFFLIFLYYMLSAPVASRSFVNRQGITIHVGSNESLGSVANELESKKVVRQAFVLKVLVSLFGSPRHVPRGDYIFKESVPVWSIAWKLARGDHGIDPVKVTFREGMTNEDMATLLSLKLKAFRRDLFLSDPKSKQGHLFPDTYFFFPLTTSDEILEEISANFDKRLAPLHTDISNSNHSLDDILTMASLIQKEAQGPQDAPTVSGILWKRIAKGMPLQVDADRSTYANIGLPKSPIGNPGLVAIKAALYPEDSPYLYYLHDKNGTIHLAKTFTEHKANIARYLK